MAFRIYVCLMLRAGSKGHCWPSQELIASEVGLQVRQLRDHLKDLEEAGWIMVQRRRNKPSIYRLNHAVKKCRSS
jgi:predicted ArsR family transcriptional regulator